jgi:hypothetical protein
MASKVFMPLINRLAPAIPAWFIINLQPKTAVIKPYKVAWIVSIEIRTHPTAQSRGTSLIGQTILRIQRGGSEEAPMQHA